MSRRRPERQVVHPAAVVGRVRRAGHHGGARDRESPRPAGDDPGRAADELLGPAAGVHAADRRVSVAGERLRLVDAGARHLRAVHVRPGRWRRSWRCCLKRTLLRGETPPFVMEMPLYKVPSPLLVLRRALEASWEFLARAGTIILATILVDLGAAQLPERRGRRRRLRHEDRRAQRFDQGAARGRSRRRKKPSARTGPTRSSTRSARKSSRPRKRSASCRRNGRKKRTWDSSATGSNRPSSRSAGTGGSRCRCWPHSRPARRWSARSAWCTAKATSTRRTRRTSNGLGGRIGEIDAYTIPVVLSVLVFFALCCQCARRWPSFVARRGAGRGRRSRSSYLTALAYAGAFVTYQVGTWIVGVMT